jgi:hypothetical protein
LCFPEIIRRRQGEGENDSRRPFKTTKNIILNNELVPQIESMTVAFSISRTEVPKFLMSIVIVGARRVNESEPIGD